MIDRKKIKLEQASNSGLLDEVDSQITIETQKVNLSRDQKIAIMK